jgi:hypothetical protein
VISAAYHLDRYEIQEVVWGYDSLRGCEQKLDPKAKQRTRLLEQKAPGLVLIARFATWCGAADPAPNLGDA